MHCLYSVYVSLKIRSIVTNVAKAMKEKGMNVVGELENVCLSVSHPKILTGFVATRKFHAIQYIIHNAIQSCTYMYMTV